MLKTVYRCIPILFRYGNSMGIHGNDEHQIQARGYLQGERERGTADCLIKASTVPLIFYFNPLKRSEAKMAKC